MWEQILIAGVSLVVGWVTRHVTIPTPPTPTPTPAPSNAKPTPILDALRSFLKDAEAIAEHEALAVLQQLAQPKSNPIPAGRSPVGA